STRAIPFRPPSTQRGHRSSAGVGAWSGGTQRLHGFPVHSREGRRHISTPSSADQDDAEARGETMTGARASVFSRLPGISFPTLPTPGETSAICGGDSNYYRVESTRTADELNELYGVTRAQARAMLAGIVE